MKKKSFYLLIICIVLLAFASGFLFSYLSHRKKDKTPEPTPQVTEEAVITVTPKAAETPEPSQEPLVTETPAPTEPPAPMDFQGKTADFLGDSQTEVNYHKSKIYYQWVQELLGLASVNNYGISGTTIAQKDASDNTAFCVRYREMDPSADLICVMGGVNDVWFNTPLGEPGSTDPTTFYGGMDTLCRGLLETFPDAVIVFITPTEQVNALCTEANTTGLTPTDFSEAMKEVCAGYSIPVYDANTLSGIYPPDPASRDTYTTDGLHLNDLGHETLARQLADFLLEGNLSDPVA